MGETPNRTVKSVANACTIIDCIRELRGGTISTIANNVDMSIGSVHTQLATLKEQGFVIQDGSTYDLGPNLLTIGEYVRNQDDLYQASKEEIERLADETGECAHLIFEYDCRLYVLYERFGTKAVGTEIHTRKREEGLNHLHCTAAGKAILAHMPDEMVQRIVDTTGLPSRTPHTITDRDTLHSTLETVRSEGVAFSDEEQIHGIRAVGTPILDSTGAVQGAIALSGPASRLHGDRFHSELPQRVMQAANVCEVNLQTIDFEEEI